MRRRKLALVGAGVSLAVLAAACSSSSTSSSARSGPSGAVAATGAPPSGAPIVVGMDLDSTGPGASYSTIAGKTIGYAVDDINKNGGVLGRPLKLVTENDESDPTKTPAIIQKLIGEGAKMLLLQSGGAAVLQAKPTLQRLGIPAISPTSVTATVALPPDNDYSYMLANATSDWAKVYCGAFAKANIHNLAVLTDDTTTLAALDKVLFAAMPCVTIIDTEKGASAASDLNAQVARLKNAKPDAVLVTSVGGAFEVLAQNTLADQMPTAPRFSLASIGNQPSAWRLANPGALKGLVFMGSINSRNPQTQRLVSFLQARNGSSYQVTAYDADGWDAVQLVKKAVEAAGGAEDPKKLNQAVQSISQYKASFGQPGFTLSYTATKHLGADGLCGLSLIEFGPDNKPSGPWPTYQPPCNS